MKIILTFLIIFLFFNFNANAAEIKFSKATHKDGRYFIKVFGVVQANPQKVFDILTDYNHITKISPKVIESKIVRTEGNAVIVKTIAKGCVWFFCKKIINTQATTTSGTTIDAVTLPGESNLKVGKMHWEIKRIPSGTAIDYYAEIETDFFVPPIIGTFFIKRSLLEEATALVETVEKLANEQ